MAAKGDEIESDENEANTQKGIESAIVIQHRGGPDEWGPTVLQFNNDDMRDVLEDVLQNYQDLDLEVEKWCIEKPFMPLVHRWDALQEKATGHGVKQQHREAAVALMKEVEPLITEPLAALARVKSDGKIDCYNAWMLYAPGTLVVTSLCGVQTVCRVVKYRQKSSGGWSLRVEYVDWDGQSCGYNRGTDIVVTSWSGLSRVTKLEAYPLSLHPDPQTLQKSMIERGLKFEHLRGYHFVQCCGTKRLLQTDSKERQMRLISGEVCIDAYAYYKDCNLVSPKLYSLEKDKVDVSGPPETEKSPRGSSPDSAGDSDVGMDTGDEGGDDDAEVSTSIESSSEAKGPKKRPSEDLTPLTATQCLLASPWLKAFDMKSKSWCEIRVDDVSPIAWNDEAYEKLVLPGGEKELAWAFVENKTILHSASSSADTGVEGEIHPSFDDFIQDKGQGLIILMFGPPGVGKTFTAEGIAEKCRVPLYSMSAGDLGTQPAEVEAALDRALLLCQTWNAMLLLDEADVFLGKRTSESLARNELVSIFLTKLEYYSGVLFLTTNRVSTIDPAFQSRVDLFLPYHDLKPEARRKVWENFMEKSGGKARFDFGDEGEAALDKLAELKLNGREIKNLIKSAGLLSLKNKGSRISVDLIYNLASTRVKTLAALDGVEGF